MHRLLAVLVPLVLALAGCSSGQNEVVVYAALDREFSEPILNDFTKATGIAVVAKYDVESTKTVGLTQAIIAESNRPRCDVFWNNEVLNSLRLEEKGLLAVYRSPVAESYPDYFRSKSGTWHGFAGRARVLLVNTKVVPKDEMPKSIYDLADKKWKGKVGLAKPLFGTSATHAACLFASLGDDKAKEFFHSLKANEIKIQGGNKQVAVAVGSGQLAFGLTDTDDAIIELERGAPVVKSIPTARRTNWGPSSFPTRSASSRGHRTKPMPANWWTISCPPPSRKSWPWAKALKFRLASRSKRNLAWRRRRPSTPCPSISPQPPKSGTRQRNSFMRSSRQSSSWPRRGMDIRPPTAGTILGGKNFLGLVDIDRFFCLLHACDVSRVALFAGDFLCLSRRLFLYQRLLRKQASRPISGPSAGRFRASGIGIFLRP